MSEKIVFGIDIETGKAAQSFNGIKTELKALSKALAEIDPDSNAFQVATQRAGQLREQIRGVNDAIENADPEKKFAPFARTIQGLAGGFSAVQGAMGLMGVESKELEKTLLKVQSAMALSQGLNSLLEFKNDFADLGKMVIPMVTKAFSTLKGAILSTGIGALVIALGIAINEIIKYNEAIDEESNAQERLNDELKKTEDLMKGVADESEKNRNAKKGGLDDLTREKELLEAKGATEKEIFEKGQEIANRELQNLITRKYSGLNVTKEIADKENEIKANQLAYEKKVEDDKIKARKDLLEKKLAAEKKHDEDLALWKKEAEDRKDAEDKKRDEERIKLLKKLRVDLPKQFTQEEIDAIKNSNKTKFDLAIAEKNAKLDSMQAVNNALRGYAQLADEHTIAAKFAAVATTTIDTYVAAQKAYTSQLVPGDPTSPLRGLFFAGAAVASGLANVRKILAVNKNSSSPPTPSSTSTSVPQFNPAVAQQVQGGGDVQLGMKPQKVYVVESDIRGSMNKVDVIQSNAKIG